MGDQPVDPWSAGGPEQLRRRRRLLGTRARTLATALLATLVYAAASLTVVGLDVRSESDKRARGAYPNTFPPLSFARLARPARSAWPATRYPDGPFDEAAYRAVLRTVLHDCLVAAALQATVLHVVVAVVGLVATRSRSR